MILSAFSIFISFLILQPIACWLDPSFNLLANKNIGKIAFTFLVIYQIILLIYIQPKNFLKNFFETNFLFFKDKNFLKVFFKYFVIFFLLHSLLLAIFYSAGYLDYNPKWGYFSISLILKTLFGFIATFFLAWTEELIFRGTIYNFFVQNLKPITSIIFTSFIFMLVHDLHNPINLITKNWELGLGLFLLGIILNIIFVGTKKLYANIGAHAGLVFVKVVLRRAPFVLFLPPEILPFWVNKDLRMSPLTHLLFIITIFVLAYYYRKEIFVKKSNL
ncbi:MAG: CPBP family intramembrane glutamic endopeptidase [Candidatus Babeliales bacterium]